MSNRVAIVTGGTSGIGRATALALKEAGCTVYELSRRAQGVEGLHHIRADITDETQVRAAVQQVMDAEGQIDVVVNNAGSVSPVPSSLRTRPMPSACSTRTFSAWCA